MNLHWDICIGRIIAFGLAIAGSTPLVQAQDVPVYRVNAF